MGKLILEIQVSIDGFIAGIDGNTNWMLWNWGPDWTWDEELQQYHTDLTLSAACVLLSRQMAEEGFIAHWQLAASDPADARYEFAKHIVDTPKIVFSKTIDRSVPIPGNWHNAAVCAEELVPAIKKLKEKYDTILVYGGASFAASLIGANLVDEFHFFVNPVAIGAGMTIFTSIDTAKNMTLVKASSFKDGMVVLQYQLEQ